ncbi:hypothetical protein ONZ45_g11657 [Pleurotus djamor]|nr:hypothetical protein ONZ45_g11657 [Pleurotus djamor]
MPVSRTYRAVPGFFLHDDVETTVSEAIPPSFGLLDTSNDRWERLFKQVEELNEKSDEKTAFKLFFLGRHGQGIHNVAEAKYTTPIWEG